MKNAGKYADGLKSVLKRLLKDGKPQPLVKIDPIQAIVRGSLAFDAPDSKIDEGMKIIEREFVDLNELRVATELEIVAMLGLKPPHAERRAAIVTQVLNTIFEKEGTLSLERLNTLKKAESRQMVRDIPGMSSFVEAFIAMFSFDNMAMPLDETTSAYLKEEEALDPSCTLEEGQKFIENHLKAEEIYDLYAVLRREVYEGKKAKAKS